MSKRVWVYKCVSCKETKTTSSKTSFICRRCLALKNLKRASAAAIKARTLRPYEHHYRTLVRTAAHWVDLSYEEFLQFTKVTRCYYCKSDIVWNTKSVKGKYSGYNLDRKNSFLEYSTDNCVVCCGKCNKIKMDYFTANEFKQVVKLIKSIRGSW